MKRLVVDAQVFQTAAWHRGMGKYSLELLKAIHKEVIGDEKFVLELILSSNIESDPEMERTIREELDNVKVTKLDLLLDEIGNKRVPEQNRRAIDEYIGRLDTEDTQLHYLIMSAMQGVIYPTFPSADSVHKLLVFYDIIPFMFHDIYLRNGITRSEYMPRIGEILRADTFLAISKTVANDLSFYLGIAKDRIVSIDGGAIPHSNREKAVKIPKPFVLMPTGNDLRKNNKRAILGFKEFNTAHNNAYSLVITSFFKEHEQAELSSLCEDVVFTGNVTGEELNYLYHKSIALLFPSEYEGLGMPILEAVEKDKPIACSNISVFREMSTKAFTYFDPYSVFEIAASLEVVTKQKKVNAKEYGRLLKTYTWKRSAQVLLQVLSNPERIETNSHELVICGPDPAISGVGKLMQELHEEMSRTQSIKKYFLTYPASNEERRLNFLTYCYDVQYISPGIDYSELDSTSRLYFLGNGQEFSEVLFLALARPGVVLLYDSNLTATWEHMVSKNLISPERLNLESALEKEFGLHVGSGLATLLKTQEAIIVFDRDLYTAIELVVKKSGLNLRLEFLDRPAPSVVHPEALPEKSIEVSYAEKLSDAMYPTDYQLNTALSKTMQLIFSTGRINQELLFRATGLGVTSFSAGKVITPSVTSKIESQEISVQNSSIAGMLADMQDRHSLKLFSQHLAGILNKEEN